MRHRTLFQIGLSFIIFHFSFSHAVAQILPVTDPAMKRSLNGMWQLKVEKAPPSAPEGEAPPSAPEGATIDFSHHAAAKTIEAPSGAVGGASGASGASAGWSLIPVPGCWEAYGFSKPSYDKALPLTGYYRTTFTVPQQWRGQRIVLRFDGVLYGYDLYVDGHHAGQWRSAYNTALFDVTDCLDEGDSHKLELRVITQFPGSDFDCNDDWVPCGIFRDVTMMAVPETHLADLTITAKNTGEVNVDTKVANGGKGVRVSHQILDAEGRVVGTDCVKNPHLWTAETPYLYTLRTTLRGKKGVLQRFEHKFGFRELTIDGNVLLLNGKPIKLRGVTCHATDPRTVKVVSDELTLRDMRLMKEASVNYIRTSHYPREPRFYELADSMGFYIIDEVPFGYGDKNLQKEEFYPVLQQRAEATIRRDKNHPSVLIWSLGNENPLTDICQRLGEYVHTVLDPSRPYCYPQVGSYFRRFWEKAPAGGDGTKSPFPSAAPIYTPHYPTTGQIGGFYQKLDRPVIFTEYCHTLGISFEDHDRQWEIIERTPGIAGGSVWEWVDQGMPFENEKLRDGENEKSEDGVERRYGYEEKVYTSMNGGFEMYGNKGTDGLLYADRTPLPNYYELQHNYARAFISMSTDINVYDRCTYYEPDDRFPVIGELKDVVYALAENRYDFLDLYDNVFFRWALTADRDTVARGTFTTDCKPHRTSAFGIRVPKTRPDALTIMHYELVDKDGYTFRRQSFVLHKPQVQWTGTVADPMQRVQQGPLVRTGRKPTLAERVKQEGRLPQKYLLPLDNSQVKANVACDTLPDGGVEVTFALTPDTTADVFHAELGLAYLLDPAIDRVQWVGQGPFASYPGRRQANRYGFWAKHKDDLYFEGNRMGVDACWLTDKDGNGILITATNLHNSLLPQEDQSPNKGMGGAMMLNFEQTDRGLVVTVNAAVSGQGPKFARTAFNGWKPGDGMVGASFRIYRVEAGSVPPLFMPASEVPAPFRPFVTQYDTYLMRYADIAE